MKVELCTILLGTTLSSVSAMGGNDAISREQILVRRRRNAINRRMKRSNKHWNGQEHLDMPGWDNLADKLSGDDGWNGHVSKAGDITVVSKKLDKLNSKKLILFIFTCSSNNPLF